MFMQKYSAIGIVPSAKRQAATLFQSFNRNCVDYDPKRYNRNFQLKKIQQCNFGLHAILTYSWTKGFP